MGPISPEGALGSEIQNRKTRGVLENLLRESTARPRGVQESISLVNAPGSRGGIEASQAHCMRREGLAAVVGGRPARRRDQSAREMQG